MRPPKRHQEFAEDRSRDQQSTHPQMYDDRITGHVLGQVHDVTGFVQAWSLTRPRLYLLRSWPAMTCLGIVVMIMLSAVLVPKNRLVPRYKKAAGGIGKQRDRPGGNNAPQGIGDRSRRSRKSLRSGTDRVRKERSGTSFPVDAKTCSGDSIRTSSFLAGQSVGRTVKTAFTQPTGTNAAGLPPAAGIDSRSS